MRERRRREQEQPRGHPIRVRQRTSLKRRMHHRKAALALSAGVMGMSAAAMGTIPTEPAQAGVIQLDIPLTRMPARDLRASQSLKEALVREEGVRDTVYRDVAGYATVGCGHLVDPGDGLRLGDRVSYDRILDFLDGDLAEAEAAVTRIAGDLPLFQHEYDALVDLVYNVGEGNLSAKKSPRLVAAIAAHDYDAIGRELEYRYAGGQLARGLAYRSARRTQIFMNAAYDDPRESAGVVLARL
jgi:GH24 family phage-related lysozyme (muramidase)